MDASSRDEPVLIRLDDLGHEGLQSTHNNFGYDLVIHIAREIGRNCVINSGLGTFGIRQISVSLT